MENQPPYICKINKQRFNNFIQSKLDLNLGLIPIDKFQSDI